MAKNYITVKLSDIIPTRADFESVMEKMEKEAKYVRKLESLKEEIDFSSLDIGKAIQLLTPLILEAVKFVYDSLYKEGEYKKPNWFQKVKLGVYFVAFIFRLVGQLK